MRRWSRDAAGSAGWDALTAGLLYAPAIRHPGHLCVWAIHRRDDPRRRADRRLSVTAASRAIHHPGLLYAPAIHHPGRLCAWAVRRWDDPRRRADRRLSVTAVSRAIHRPGRLCAWAVRRWDDPRRRADRRLSVTAVSRAIHRRDHSAHRAGGYPGAAKMAGRMARRGVQVIHRRDHSAHRAGGYPGAAKMAGRMACRGVQAIHCRDRQPRCVIRPAGCRDVAVRCQVLLAGQAAQTCENPSQKADPADRGPWLGRGVRWAAAPPLKPAARRVCSSHRPHPDGRPRTDLDHHCCPAETRAVVSSGHPAARRQMSCFPPPRGHGVLAAVSSGHPAARRQMSRFPPLRGHGVLAAVSSGHPAARRLTLPGWSRENPAPAAFWRRGSGVIARLPAPHHHCSVGRVHRGRLDFCYFPSASSHF